MTNQEKPFTDLFLLDGGVVLCYSRFWCGRSRIGRDWGRMEAKSVATSLVFCCENILKVLKLNSKIFSSPLHDPNI